MHSLKSKKGFARFVAQKFSLTRPSWITAISQGMSGLYFTAPVIAEKAVFSLGLGVGLVVMILWISSAGY